MRSACLVRTRFILNNFSGIGLGVPGPPLGYAPDSAPYPVRRRGVVVASFGLSTKLLYVELS